MGGRASGLRGGASCVAGERRALSRARQRRASSGLVRRGRRPPGSGPRTGPGGSRDARPAGGNARGGWGLRWRDCQLRGGAEARAIGRRGGASGSRARARRPGARCPRSSRHWRPGPRPRAPTWPPHWRCECLVYSRVRRPVPLRSSPTCAGTGPGPGLSRRCAPESWRHIPITHSSPRGWCSAPGWHRRFRDARLLAGQGDRRAEAWQRAAPEFADVPPATSGLCRGSAGHGRRRARGPGQRLCPTRAVSGQELLEAVSRLQRLAGPLAGRDRR